MGTFSEDAKRVMDQVECTQTRYGNVNCPCRACAAKFKGALAMTSESIASTEAGVRNAIGIPREKLHVSPGRPRGARNLHAKHPSSLAKRFKKAGLDWTVEFAAAILAAKNFNLAPSIRRQAREDVRMWMRLLPYMVTTTNKIRVKKWKGKASRAAIVALDALEGR